MCKFLNICSEVFVKSWWVYLFMLFCALLFEHGMRKRNAEYSRLEFQLQDLRSEQKRLLAKQEDLLLQINSQSDPAWVELTLMKGLGLVPEGQTKIYFTQ